MAGPRVGDGSSDRSPWGARACLSHGAEPGRPARPCRLDVRRQDRGRPRRAPLHVPRARRAGVAARLRAPRRRHAEGRPRRVPAPEHPGDARGALRRPCGRRHPGRHQHAALGATRSATSSSTPGRELLLLDAELADLVDAARPRRHRRDPGRRHRRAGDPVRGLPRRRPRPSDRRAGSRTRRRRSRSTTPPARPGARRASMYTTAAPT